MLMWLALALFLLDLLGFLFFLHGLRGLLLAFLLAVLCLAHHLLHAPGRFAQPIMTLRRENATSFPGPPHSTPEPQRAIKIKMHFKFICIVFKYSESTKRYETIMCGRKPLVLDKTTRWRQEMRRNHCGHTYSDCSLERTHHDAKVDTANSSPASFGQQQFRWRRFHALQARQTARTSSLRTKHASAAADRRRPADLAHAQSEQRYLRRQIDARQTNGRTRRPFC